MKDIRAGITGSVPAVNFAGVVASVNGTLFFQANDGSSGEELWKSDGTSAGTVMVKDIANGGSSFPRELTNVNGTLFFRASDGIANGPELWKSDGTTAGTVMVKDIRSGGLGTRIEKTLTRSPEL